MEKRTRNIILLLMLVLVSGCSASGPYDLRCEDLTEPLGINTGRPHLSWKLPLKGTKAQTAYQIEVASTLQGLQKGEADLWASGRVESRNQVMVPWDGPELSSRQICYWRVRTWNEQGEVSGWSQTQRFTVGIIRNDQLRGEYIGANPQDGCSSIFRSQFSVESMSGSTAFLYVNSLGYHEAYVNGQKVTDAILTPAVSQMDKRSEIVTYDVTPFIRKGQNDLVLWTGSGWFKEATFQAPYGGALVKAELDLVKDGIRSTLIKTGKDWEAAWSGYSDLGTWEAGHFGGEKIDASVFPKDMDRGTLEGLNWSMVDCVTLEGITATNQMCEPNRIFETVHGVSVSRMEDGAWVIDFGKAMNAQVQIRLPHLEKGHEVTATFADHKREDGTFQERDRDIYVSSGSESGDTFRNRFNHHCFQYVILRNLDTAPQATDQIAYRFHTDYRQTATFESSDKDLNDIYSMVTYTMSNLAFSGYMVDCAHIERLGYGGDGNASTLTLQNLFDVAPVFQNWLQAWRDAIREDGGLPHTAPNPYSAGGGPYWCSFIVQAPWRTWMSYNDDRLLRECYPTMLHWLEYVDAYTVDGLLKQWPNNEYRNWYLGDWLAPEGVDVTDPRSIDLINNCAMVQSYRELVQIARHLGKMDDASRFQEKADTLSNLIHSTFYDAKEGIYASGSQIDMIYPLLTDVTPQDLRESVRSRLMERTREVYHGHLATGLVGIPVLTEWATLNGEADFVYSMLKQPDYPGYLHMLRSGGSATWESWNGSRSRLHNCYNGIGSWFYQALGGIIPLEPGYSRTLIRPQAPKGLEWVSVKRMTPYGQVEVAWNTLEDGSHSLRVRIPTGMTAVIKDKEYEAGEYSLTF